MLYRAHLQLFLVVLLAAGSLSAQAPTDTKPVSKSDIFVALEVGKESPELLKKTNAELIAAINERGVDFVLTPEEEWQLGMRDASEELLKAIREAVDPKERDARITANRQQRLYNEFSAGYNSNDLSSRRAALIAAKEFVSLYGTDQHVSEIVTFMQRNLPRLEQSVSMMEQRETAMERARSEAMARQQRIEQARQDQAQRRQESNAANPNQQGDRGAPNRPDRNQKEEAERRQPSDPVVRQPSDPIVRTPRLPIVRRP
jgi:hypothetical protein